MEHVLAYLGRYTHRVGIANSRLVEVSDDAIVFRTKDGKVISLEPVEFLGRFVQHVLPDGFHKIRHYRSRAGAPLRRFYGFTAPRLLRAANAAARAHG